MHSILVPILTSDRLVFSHLGLSIFPTIFLFSGTGRVAIGLPRDWDIIQRWLRRDTSAMFPAQTVRRSPPKKCPDIPVLSSYQLPPPAHFWKSFPSRRLPASPSSCLNVERLKAIISEHRHHLSLDQQIRADRTTCDLEFGSAAPLTAPLPASRTPNTPSVVLHGEEFTDVLAWWIRQGYVAGPFPVPPLANFRSNAMMAVEQRDKIRIIMNLSSPSGTSFNDAIDELALEKVTMSSARLFGYSLIDCGPGARMWKFDMVDAYKTVPAAQSDLRLQGFHWLGRYFIELKKVFGSKEAVSAFDRVNHTIITLATVISGLPPFLIHRTLDDVPIVTPASSPLGPLFASAYQDICKELGAQLAPPCPDFEKAFNDSTAGTVLGIQFSSSEMSWSISTGKRARIISRIRDAMSGIPISLLETQKLIGTLNDVSQMCPFLRGFRQPLQNFLASFRENENIRLSPPQAVHDDLQIWAAAVNSAVIGFPIPPRPTAHLPGALFFVSDASGAQFAKTREMFIPIPYTGDRGAASINAIEDDIIWFHAKITWPRTFLLVHRDSANHAYGCKSATLEAIALILPFLCCPQILINQQVTLLTDNEALVFGWEKRRVAHDNSASIFLRALHLISSFLGSSVEIRHLPRMSSPSAILADALTRSTTTLEAHKAAVSSAPHQTIPEVLTDWLDCPSEDWSLPITLLNHVQEMF